MSTYTDLTEPIKTLYEPAYKLMVNKISEALSELKQSEDTKSYFNEKFDVSIDFKIKCLTREEIQKNIKKIGEKLSKESLQEWGYLCSNIMDFINQKNLAGFSLVKSFKKKEDDDKKKSTLEKNEIANFTDLRDLCKTGENWSNQIFAQLKAFVPEQKTNFLIMCSEQYEKGKSDNEFATLQNDDKNFKMSDSNKKIGKDDKNYKVLNHYVTMSLGTDKKNYYFVNIHNSSNKESQDAGNDIKSFIKKFCETVKGTESAESADILRRTIFGGDSNCYYAPFGNKKYYNTNEKDGLKYLAKQYENTHNIYISKYAIAKYRPNNFLQNSQTMTKGGETDFEETMFLMVPKDSVSAINNNLYVKITSEDTAPPSILEEEHIVAFNGAFGDYKLPTNLNELDKAYFDNNLLSDHLPIGATLTLNEEKIFVCFSNNLSIQGSRGLKEKSDIWSKDLSESELEKVNTQISQKVLEVLTILQPTSQSTSPAEPSPPTLDINKQIRNMSKTTYSSIEQINGIKRKLDEELSQLKGSTAETSSNEIRIIKENVDDILKILKTKKPGIKKRVASGLSKFGQRFRRGSGGSRKKNKRSRTRGTIKRRNVSRKRNLRRS